MAWAHAELTQQTLMEARAAANNERVLNVPSTTKLSYEPGELVWLYHVLVKQGLAKKFAHLWHGPYRVGRKVNESAYELAINRKDSLIQKTTRHQGRRVLELDEALLPEDSWYEQGADDEYEVEVILVCRYKQCTRNGRRMKEFRVKWIGYDDPTWVLEDDLSCIVLLYEFEARQAWENRREVAQTTEEEEMTDSDEEEANK